MLSLLPRSSQNTKKKAIYTEEFFSQHAQLLLVEALTGEGGELPAEDLGELAPGGPRRVTEERQVLRRVVEKALIRSHVHIITANKQQQQQWWLTLGSSVRRLYHMTDAQPPGSWLTLEMTTNGREHVWKESHTSTTTTNNNNSRG